MHQEMIKCRIRPVIEQTKAPAAVPPDFSLFASHLYGQNSTLLVRLLLSAPAILLKRIFSPNDPRQRSCHAPRR